MHLCIPELAAELNIVQNERVSNNITQNGVTKDFTVKIIR